MALPDYVKSSCGGFKQNKLMKKYKSVTIFQFDLRSVHFTKEQNG